MTVKLTLLAAGYCTQSEHILFRGGVHKTIQFPAMFALLEHPTHGPILFDTGYSERFFVETRAFPASLYRQLTPVYLRPEETAVRQLAARGIAASDVPMIIISHFHADHVCGLADFPNARYLYFDDAYTAIRQRRGINALRAGFLPGLIPPDFSQRSQPVVLDQLHQLPDEYAPFDQGADLLGDGTLIAVCVPGHAVGQMGLFVQADDGERYFLVADACWHSRAYRENILPNPLVRLIFANWRDYRASFAKICQFHRNRPEVHIIPAHCSEVYARYLAL
jgi:glyoxylase-like metal-dependent hydrolase (beta-lactamase superfamily II)